MNWRIHVDKFFIRNSDLHLRCFLPPGPGLRSLTLKHRRENFKLSNEICEAIASLLVQNCSSIVTLDVEDSAFFENIDKGHLPNLFLGLQKLQNIHGYIVLTSKEIIRHLGLLPSLKSIQGLSLHQDTNVSLFATADGHFQTMDSLQLYASGWDKVAVLLSTMHCRFETLDIQLLDFDDVDEELPTSHTFQDLTSTLASNLFLNESLKTIKITDTREYKLYAELLPSTFQPFLSFRALQHFVLQIADLEHLNDKWLAEAALAWPDIRTLIIGAIDNRFSLKGLIPLLKNCRKITTLELHPTAISFDLSLLPADGSTSNTNITGIFSLHKVEADEMDPFAVFACLTAMFPNVSGVERANIMFSVDFASCDEDEDEYRDKWETLEQMFKERFPL